MNAKRRKQIDKIVEQLADLATQIDEVVTDEQDALDNLPESLQDSDRAEVMQEAVSSLEEAAGYIEEIETALNTARDGG